MEMEGDTDRSWRISQDEIVDSISVEAARGRKEFTLGGGPQRARYTRNGRHMAVVGQKGHIATFDWQTGTMLSELQLQETCRDITCVRPDLSPFPNMGLLSPVSCWIIHNTQSPKRNMYSSMIVTASSFIG